MEDAYEPQPNRSPRQDEGQLPGLEEGPVQETYPRDHRRDRPRAAAMAHFNVSDDARFSYVLTHKASARSPNTTLGSRSRGAHALDFRLVKVITQG